MLAYRSSAKRLHTVHAFAPDTQGFDDFGQFLQAMPTRSVRLIVDVIEEELRIDSMPRVFGSDRKALTQRLLLRHFHTSRYRNLVIQGRHRTGRRDLRVLVSAVTDTELLDCWVNIINRNRVPLQGIHSLPLVGESLLPYLKAEKCQALLVTQQSSGAVRQSFYDRGQLRLSRQIPFRCEGDTDHANSLVQEVRDTLSFLRTQRLSRPDESVNVHIISSVRRLAALQGAYANKEAVVYRTWEHDSLAQRLGLRGGLPTEFADGLFVHLLNRQHRSTNHYATPKMRTDFFHLRACGGLYALAAAILLFAIVAATVKVVDGRLYDSYMLEAQAEVARYEGLNKKLLDEIGAFPVPADGVKVAVDIVRALDNSIRADPATLMILVGQALNRHPGITVHAMHWLADKNADASPVARVQEANAARDDQFEVGERYHIALIKGHVVDFDNSYRGAVDRFDAFVGTLRDDDRFDAVEVRRTPFDISPQAAISGSSGTASNLEQAYYELLLRVKPRDV